MDEVGLEVAVPELVALAVAVEGKLDRAASATKEAVVLDSFLQEACVAPTPVTKLTAAHWKRSVMYWPFISSFGLPGRGYRLENLQQFQSHLSSRRKLLGP